MFWTRLWASRIKLLRANRFATGLFTLNQYNRIKTTKGECEMESNQPQFSSSPTPAPIGNQRIMAIASLVLGVINLCAWFLPICGIPLSVAGLVLGFLGMKDPSQKTLAIAGMVLSGLFSQARQPFPRDILDSSSSGSQGLLHEFICSFCPFYP